MTRSIHQMAIAVGSGEFVNPNRYLPPTSREADPDSESRVRALRVAKLRDIGGAMHFWGWLVAFLSAGSIVFTNNMHTAAGLVSVAITTIAVVVMLSGAKVLEKARKEGLALP